MRRYFALAAVVGLAVVAAPWASRVASAEGVVLLGERDGIVCEAVPAGSDEASRCAAQFRPIFGLSLSILIAAAIAALVGLARASGRTMLAASGLGAASLAAFIVARGAAWDAWAVAQALLIAAAVAGFALCARADPPAEG